MIDLKTRNGLSVSVPEDVAEDASPHFEAGNNEAIRDYFHENGYVVVSRLMPPETTRTARELWDSEIKPFTGRIYRQATAKLERHALNERGWVMNPILNLQSLDPRYFGRLREHARHNIFAAAPLRDAFTDLLGERPKIVQSMYFEGNSATWEHHDSYYLDSEHIGSMVGAWIALEDISPRAGRFFLIPGSHKFERQRHSAENNIATAHDAYVRSVVDRLRETGTELRAPALREGDVLFWSSLTIHGSLNSQDRNSRSSITCHAIPARHRFMQFQTRVMDVPTEEVGGVQIYAPKDQARLSSRLVTAAEERFPGPFYALKKAAVRMAIR